MQKNNGKRILGARRNCGPWEVLRPLKAALRSSQNHPHYVGNNNESLRLDQVIAASPPKGGMQAYIADLNRSPHPRK